MSWYSEKIKTQANYTATDRISDLVMLYPPFAFSVIKLFAKAQSEQLLVCIFETYRSQERQLELFNKGATKLKKNGMHHFGIAADLVFLDGQKNPSWDVIYNWTRLGKIGQDLGLEWGGSWSGFVDKPHFQLISATVAEQQKIIKEKYPPYAAHIDGDAAALIQLYKDAKANNFSDANIAHILGYATPPVVSSPHALIFTRELSEGVSGADVLMLQKILNADADTRIALQGAGSPGHETNYFGGLTTQAVQKFQIKFHIAAPGDQGYGIVGPHTRKKLEALASALHI